MKTIPFVQNSPDDLHCVNAVFRMVHQYFFGQDLTWKQIDQLTKTVPGKATWTFVGEMKLAKKGLKITNIEPIDYQELYKQGKNYLKKVMGKPTANFHLQKSHIASVIKYIPMYLKTVKHETRRATVKEITELLKQGVLIGAEINSRILAHQPGFNLHFVLLYEFDGKNIILHDPGLPPIKSRVVSLYEFDKCFNFPEANGGITVFRR